MRIPTNMTLRGPNQVDEVTHEWRYHPRLGALEGNGRGSYRTAPPKVLDYRVEEGAEALPKGP